MKKMNRNTMIAWRELVVAPAATAPTASGLGTAVCMGRSAGDLRHDAIAAKRVRTTGKRGVFARSAGSPAWSPPNLVS